MAAWPLYGITQLEPQYLDSQSVTTFLDRPGQVYTSS